jgi:hypothetical protein
MKARDGVEDDFGRPINSEQSTPYYARSFWHACEVGSAQQVCVENSLFARLISHQPAVLFSQNEPATATSRNQPAVLFSQNKPAPAISHQPTEQAGAHRQKSPPADDTCTWIAQFGQLCSTHMVGEVLYSLWGYLAICQKETTHT